MSYFLGLTFCLNNLQYKKIDSFRQRFDRKYSRSKMLQMTLLPPFEITLNHFDMIEELTEAVNDIFENHLYQNDELKSIDFTGIDFSMGKSGVLYLCPHLPIELFHALEEIYDVFKDYKIKFRKKKFDKSSLKTFLPIGRFDYPHMLEEAVNSAREEFNIPFKLDLNSVVLFEKTPGQWIQKRQIFSFKDSRDNFLGERYNLNIRP